LSKRGVAVLILPVDVSKAEVSDEPAFAVHRATPVLRPSDAELDRIAQVLNAGTKIAIYGGSGCDGAHDEIIALADRLKAPIAHTSRAKDFLEYENPFPRKPASFRSTSSLRTSAAVILWSWASSATLRLQSQPFCHS
jgi:pyruvate dehydrogenase (quinone)